MAPRVSGGRAERLTRDLTDYDVCCLEIAAASRTVVSVQNSLVSDLWIAPVDQLEKPRQITWGAPVFRRHGWLPDNDTIVYRDLNGNLRAKSLLRCGKQILPSTSRLI